MEWRDMGDMVRGGLVLGTARLLSAGCESSGSRGAAGAAPSACCAAAAAALAFFWPKIRTGRCFTISSCEKTRKKKR